MTNAINWFEIPVKNFDRAKVFYATLFGADIQEMPHPSFRYGMLPYEIHPWTTLKGMVKFE
jgi:predicted enzyme related to lactoylglutathione lyase